MDQLVAIMATGSGRPDVDKPGRDLPVLVHVPWSTPGARVTLGSDELYDYDTECVPDILGLRARRPEAAMVKVMSGTKVFMMSCSLTWRMRTRHMLL